MRLMKLVYITVILTVIAFAQPRASSCEIPYYSSNDECVAACVSYVESVCGGQYCMLQNYCSQVGDCWQTERCDYYCLGC